MSLAAHPRAESQPPPGFSASAAPKQIEVRSLAKSFQQGRVRWGRRVVTAQTPALVDINFDAAPGEIVTLLGPSGCGKTTLLRIIAGLAKADSGEVLVNGRPVVGPSKDKAMVFQHFGLLPWRNVLDNVAFALELDGVALAKRREVAAHYLGLVGLAGFEKHYPHNLSGGMQQRVGIARALTREPALLLMDEPFGALDAQTREILQEELLNILAVTRNTVVCVTHSIAEAVLISNKVLVFTPLPGRVKTVVDIPRAVAGDPRNAPQRKALEHELRELLREDRNDAGR